MATKRFYTQIRIVTILLISVFVLAGIVTGLRQQLPDLEKSAIQCETRTRILRDRLVNTMERSKVSAEAEAAYANLLRETRAACADRSPELKRTLETIQGIANEAKAWRHRSARAQTELRAL